MHALLGKRQVDGKLQKLCSCWEKSGLNAKPGLHNLRRKHLCDQYQGREELLFKDDSLSKSRKKLGSCSKSVHVRTFRRFPMIWNLLRKKRDSIQEEEEECIPQQLCLSARRELCGAPHVPKAQRHQRSPRTPPACVSCAQPLTARC